MGGNDNLENLVRSGGLKLEPPDRKECVGLVRSAADRLHDAHNPTLSYASRFDLAYNAADALALAAMRMKGYQAPTLCAFWYRALCTLKPLLFPTAHTAPDQ
jgi:hypothetical protein